LRGSAKNIFNLFGNTVWHNWNALYFRTLWSTNESRRDTNEYKWFSFKCHWSILISLKMIDFSSWRIYEIFKLLYLWILWDTNESRKGTNGYKRFSFEWHKWNKKILKLRAGHFLFFTFCLTVWDTNEIIIGTNKYKRSTNGLRY